jgi:hypothetical protein
VARVVWEGGNVNGPLGALLFKGELLGFVLARLCCLTYLCSIHLFMLIILDLRYLTS